MIATTKTNMRRKIKYFVIAQLLYLCFPIIGRTQPGYQSAGIIHRDKYVTVELQFKLNDPCTAGGNGKKSRYRYVITGTPRGYDYYLNWWMDYYNCNQSITSQSSYINIGNFANEGVVEYIDWAFDGYKLEKSYYSVSESSTPLIRPSRTGPIPKSTAPKSVTGNTSLTYGEQTTLTIKDGTLGRNAQWKWYEGKCGGQPAGTGEAISVTPEQDKTYFVRAESPTDTTVCISVNIKVALESSAADYIEGRKIICRGESNIPLTVSGGKLGKDAEWVWYEDSIGTNFIGKGKAIFVSPGIETVYWVRAESKINISAARSIRIKVVNEQLKDPDGITGKSFICKGSALELKVRGGQLSLNASWCWYKNSISAKNLVTKDANVIITPEENTVYILRGEGVCSNTIERSIAVNAGALSISPTAITSAYDPDSKRKVILSVSGGSLGEKAGWVWYKGNCEPGNKVGKGSRITVKTNKKTVFYARAVGECNTTACVSRMVYPRFAQKYTFINVGIIPSFNTFSGNVSANFKKIQESPVISLTIGKLAETGWYLRGKYSSKFKTSAYTIQDDVISGYSNTGSYYVYNGNTADNRWAITAGFVQKMNRAFYVLAGIGYGQRDLMWDVNEYSSQNNSLLKESWGRNLNGSYKGVEAEATLLLRVSFLNIAIGINGIAPTNSSNSQNTGSTYKIYGDCYAGVGISF